MTLQEARERAQALFNKKEEAQREGQKAMQEYRASFRASLSAFNRAVFSLCASILALYS